MIVYRTSTVDLAVVPLECPGADLRDAEWAVELLAQAPMIVMSASPMWRAGTIAGAGLNEHGLARLMTDEQVVPRRQHWGDSERRADSPNLAFFQYRVAPRQILSMSLRDSGHVSVDCVTSQECPNHLQTRARARRPSHCRGRRKPKPSGAPSATSPDRPTTLVGQTSPRPQALDNP